MIDKRTTDEEIRVSMGKIKAVCQSDNRTDPKTDVGGGELQVGWGLAGDSHAGPPRPNRWEISLLAWEDTQALGAEEDIEVYPGCFAENLVTEGLDTISLVVGDQLRIGQDIILEVEQRGKPLEIAHTYNYQGHSLLPAKGIFCRIVQQRRIRGD